MLAHSQHCTVSRSLHCAGPSSPHLGRPGLRRQPLHVVRFKEGERLDEDVTPGKRADVPEVTPTETVKGGPGLQREGDVTQAVHHGHLDPVARSRDALNKLLGRHERSNATPAAAVQPKPARSSKVPPAFEAPLSVPVFSRRREVLVGRVAMAAFYATCQWEVLTGLGPVHQISRTSGLPGFVVYGLLGAFVLHGLYGFSPSTPTWSSGNRHDLLRRPVGVPRAVVNPFAEPGRFFGFSEWGFTKANEVFAGRLAMLGWLGVALTEHMSGGKGPIGQIAWWLHLPTFQAYYQIAELGLVVLPIVFGALAFYNRRPGQVGGGDDIY